MVSEQSSSSLPQVTPAPEPTGATMTSSKTCSLLLSVSDVDRVLQHAVHTEHLCKNVHAVTIVVVVVIIIGSCAASFKRPLLSVAVSVCLVSETLMLNIWETKRFEGSCPTGAYRKMSTARRLVTSSMTSRDSMTS